MVQQTYSDQNPCGYMEGQLLCQAGAKQGFTGKNKDIWQGLLGPRGTEGALLPWGFVCLAFEVCGVCGGAVVVTPSPAQPKFYPLGRETIFCQHKSLTYTWNYLGNWDSVEQSWYGNVHFCSICSWKLMHVKVQNTEPCNGFSHLPQECVR